MPTLQHFDYNEVDITFYDFDEVTHSVPCQPRDIHIIDPVVLDTPAVKEAIARDIQEVQGFHTKELKFSF